MKMANLKLEEEKIIIVLISKLDNLNPETFEISRGNERCTLVILKILSTELQRFKHT